MTSTTEDLTDFIDDFMSKDENANIQTTTQDQDVGIDEDLIHIEKVETVEATPFFPDTVELSPDSQEDILNGEDFKYAVERQLSESGKITSIDYEVDGNKIMIQELKSSVVSLKVSTSRIEREVKELSDTVVKFNTDRQTLDNSLVDLEFRFNELVTHEDGDLGTRRETTNTSNNEESEKNADFQKHIVTLIERLEIKVKLMDEKICTIDQQNAKAKSLSEEILRHEKIVEDLKKMLTQQADELTRINSQKAQQVTTKVSEQKTTTTENIKPSYAASSPSSNFVALQSSVNEFIAKTELNERSIATAWVGLVGALLLIPMAWIMGKFF